MMLCITKKGIRFAFNVTRMSPHSFVLKTSQINNLTLHLKQLEKEEMKNPRFSRRKEVLKIRAEINAKETKDTIAKINIAKSWFFEKNKQN